MIFSRFVHRLFFHAWSNCVRVGEERPPWFHDTFRNEALCLLMLLSVGNHLVGACYFAHISSGAVQLATEAGAGPASGPALKRLVPSGLRPLRPRHP